MKYLLIIFSALSLYSVTVEANCLKNINGEVVCGKGDCIKDRYEKVYCAKAGGGALVDGYGKVQCGIGFCVKDRYKVVWCSNQPGGGAAIDLYGKVKCLGSCIKGSAEYCE